MAKVPVYNMEGSAVGEIELKDEIFGVDINEHLVHMAVAWFIIPVMNECPIVFHLLA